MSDDQRTTATFGLEEDYELIGELGRGGVSIVYLARERLLGREVAIKVIRERYLRDTEAVARLEREAQTLARISHPHIVTLYGAKRLADGSVALLMQHLRGETIRQAVQRNGRFAGEDTERILRELGSALVYLHEQGVVHRDVKPENIFLEHGTGRAVLSDFGLAKGMDGLVDVTLAGSVIGTPAYMSPEQIDGSELDGRSDIYSLGLVAYELLSGVKPWDGEGLYSVIYKQKNEELPRLDQVCPEAPERLRTAITRALAKDRAQRWATARDLVTVLDGELPAKDIPVLKVFAPAVGTQMPVPSSAALTVSLPADIAFANPVSVAGPAAASPVPVQQFPSQSVRFTRNRLAAAAAVLVLIAGAGTLIRISSPAPASAERMVPVMTAPTATAPAAVSAPAADSAVPSGWLPMFPGFLTASLTGESAAPADLQRQAQHPARRLPAQTADTAPSPAEPSSPDAAAPASFTPALTREAPASGTALALRTAAPLLSAAPLAKATEARAEPTTAPRLRNPGAVRSRLEGELRGKGVSGTVDLLMGVDENGRVISTSVASGSGHAVLDAAAVEAASAMRFAPAETAGRRVPASVRVPVTYEGDATAPSTSPSNSSTDVSPKLLNSDDVQSALAAAYPSAMRRAGIGGTVRLLVTVGEDGRVVDSSVVTASGHKELDAAAVRLARTMKFAPGRRDGQPVSSSVRIPLIFESDARW